MPVILQPYLHRVGYYPSGMPLERRAPYIDVARGVELSADELRRRIGEITATLERNEDPWLTRGEIRQFLTPMGQATTYNEVPGIILTASGGERLPELADALELPYRSDVVEVRVKEGERWVWKSAG